MLPQSLVERLISEYQIPSTILPRKECRKGGIGRFWSLLMLARIQARLTNDLNSSSDRWMVISQDCDLVQHDWAKEPYVELLRIQAAKGDCLPPAWGQNPREMQFDDPPGSKNQHRFVCSVHHRVWIDRRYLEDFTPDDTRQFSRENVRRICLWVSRRYVRAAFPDEFNNRIKEAMDALTKRNTVLDKQSVLLTGVYIRVSEEELAEDEEYRVVVWATMRTAEYEDPKKVDEAQKLVDLLEATLGSCKGIDIAECVLKSEQDLTLDHLHSWKRWDFDVLSWRPKSKNGPWPSVDEVPPNA